MGVSEGDSLSGHVVVDCGVTVPDGSSILRDVVDAVAGARRKGVVHRDIVPGNVLVTGSHAMVADFGVAKADSEAT